MDSIKNTIKPKKTYIYLLKFSWSTNNVFCKKSNVFIFKVYYFSQKKQLKENREKLLVNICLLKTSFFLMFFRTNFIHMTWIIFDQESISCKTKCHKCLVKPQFVLVFVYLVLIFSKGKEYSKQIAEITQCKLSTT